MGTWTKLCNIYQDNRGTRILLLENQFGMTKLTHYPTLSDYCQALKSISDQLAAMDHPISEERLVLQLVGKLTTEYSMVATLIQQSMPLSSFEKACSMLELDRTSREKNQDESGSSSALVLLAASSGASSCQTPQQPPSSGHGGGNSGHGGGNYGRGDKNKKGGEEEVIMEEAATMEAMDKELRTTRIFNRIPYPLGSTCGAQVGPTPLVPFPLNRLIGEAHSKIHHNKAY